MGLSVSQSTNEFRYYIKIQQMCWKSLFYRVNVFQGVVGGIPGVNLKRLKGEINQKIFMFMCDFDKHRYKYKYTCYVVHIYRGPTSLL